MISPVQPDSVPPRADRYPSLAQWAGDVAFAPIEVEVEPGWSRFNPSLASVGDGGVRGVIRSSNYRLDDGTYVTVDREEVIRTTNYLVDVDQRGTAMNARPITVPEGRAVSDFPVQGFEDVRLAPVGDALWALATVRDVEVSGLCRIALLLLAEDGRVLDERIVAGPTPGRHEKNWVPFKRGAPGDETVTVVYSWDPLVVAEIVPDAGRAGVAQFREVSRTASGLGPNVRGGTNGVRIDDGWLFLVHESRRFPDRSLRYLHRFVTVKDDFTVARVSPLLTLLGDGVEFALGAAQIGDDLLIGFGFEDAEAWSARTNLANVIERLEPFSGKGVPS